MMHVYQGYYHNYVQIIHIQIMIHILIKIKYNIHNTQAHQVHYQLT